MDTLLLAVTVISLAAAIVSIMAVRKLKHTDHVRSDARVAALVAAADAPPVHADPLPARPERAQRVEGARVETTRAVTTDGTWNSVAGEWQWTPEPAGTRDRIPNPQSRIPGTESAMSSSDLFGTVRREQPASGRFAFAAGLALLVALGGAAVVFTSSNHQKASAPAAQARHVSPLELVSLGHSRDASSLTINGVVRNPANGPRLEGLTAVVSLIDEHGGLVSTKDVPLDYRALGPGEEAPFKVTVPDPGSISTVMSAAFSMPK